MESYNETNSEHQDPVFPISEYQGTDYLENDEVSQQSLESYKRHLWEREDARDGVWAEMDKLD